MAALDLAYMWRESMVGEEGLASAGGRGADSIGMQQVSLRRTEGQMFRERVAFVLMCIIGAFASMRILMELKPILEPFLWSLFLVMAWKPVVDGLERRIEWMLVSGCGARGRGSSARCSPQQNDDILEEEQSLLEDSDLDPSESEGARRPPEAEVGRTRRQGKRRKSASDLDADVELGVSREGGSSGGMRARKAMARTFAVIVATCGMAGLLFLFGFFVMESVRHMRDHWDVYQRGAQKLTAGITVLFKKVPKSMLQQYQEASDDMLKTAQDMVYELLGDFVNNVSSLLIGFLLTMLYTLFWLCSPVPMDSSMGIMFRKYIMFKTLACFGYGICTGLLLAFLSIDLASVFALTTFALNYVPEVGPFVAMLLPCPVILLDGRLERPWFILLVAILAQLALKFAFSNIIEVKLIESDKKLRMHPVMILLSVGVFGHLWGPTGMLLSVPLMAVLKISLFSELVPASYRDPILVILEGDRDAPKKHGLRPVGSNDRGGLAPPGG